MARSPQREKGQNAEHPDCARTHLLRGFDESLSFVCFSHGSDPQFGDGGGMAGLGQSLPESARTRGAGIPSFDRGVAQGTRWTLKVDRQESTQSDSLPSRVPPFCQPSGHSPGVQRYYNSQLVKQLYVFWGGPGLLFAGSQTRAHLALADLIARPPREGRAVPARQDRPEKQIYSLLFSCVYRSRTHLESGYRLNADCLVRATDPLRM